MSSGPQWAYEQEQEAQWRSEEQKGNEIKQHVGLLKAHTIMETCSEILKDVNYLENNATLTKAQFSRLTNIKTNLKILTGEE